MKKRTKIVIAFLMALLGVHIVYTSTNPIVEAIGVMLELIGLGMAVATANEIG